jgi:hypothetical protein
MTARAQQLDTKSDRGKSYSTQRKTEQAIGWVERPISSQINEKARLWKVSRSKAIARLITMGLASDFFQEYEKLLTDAVSRAVAREHQKDRNQIMKILFRVYIRVSQLIYLVINLLGRSGTQRRVTAEQLDKIIDWSRSQAREDVAKRSGKTEALGQAVEEWLNEDAETERGREQGENPPTRDPWQLSR